MSGRRTNPRTFEVQDGPLSNEIAAFLVDRQARGLRPRTIDYYREKLAILVEAMADEENVSVRAITARRLRSFLVTLQADHNPGGVHAVFRAVRAFLLWWEEEVEPDNWSNPLDKVKAPRTSLEPLSPVGLDDLRAMLATCSKRCFHGDRDRAILLFLLDSGVRRAEMCALDVDDVDLETGAVLVRHGKGGKLRTTYIGARTRRALTGYYRHRDAVARGSALWVTVRGSRLSYAGLREVVRRRAARAQVVPPSLHSFRRAFALNSLRGGASIYEVQRLMGHSSLSVLARYLALTKEDLARAHRCAGPVDTML